MAGERVELDIISKRLNEDTPGEDFSLELRGPEFVEVCANDKCPHRARKALNLYASLCRGSSRVLSQAQLTRPGLWPPRPASTSAS